MAEKVELSRKKVGLCWRGNDSGAIKGRSVPLSLFHDISRLPGCRFISLQKGSVQDEIIRANVKMENFEGELDEGPDAFLDTGAIISLCDLVITIDTSIAHLAGAMGARTWLILKKVPDWRWGLLSDRSPWYPNLTLYRESELLGWMNVLEKIKSDLSNL